MIFCGIQEIWSNYLDSILLEIKMLFKMGGWGDH